MNDPPKIRVAKIAVYNTAYHFDKIFDYIIPKELCDAAKKGCRVLVPFGSGNKNRQGMIMDVTDFCGEAQKLKSISSVLDEEPLLSDEMVKLALFISERYFCTIHDAIKAMLPTGIYYRLTLGYSVIPNAQERFDELSAVEQQVFMLVQKSKDGISEEKIFKTLGYDSSCKIPENLVKKGFLQTSYDANRFIGDKTVKMVRLTGTEENTEKLSKKQQEVYELLQSVGEVSVKEICYFTGLTVSVINSLVKKRIAEFFEEEVFRIPVSSEVAKNDDEIKLSEEQQKAFDDLFEKYKSGKSHVSLLYGVTGSGKTSVFMRLIDTAYRENKGIIVMVPEISLTPQMIGLFKSRFGSDIAVFHSGLSMGERLDEWKRVKNGIAKIAIGTRSAVFAPFSNLGLIIMDEEQEYTYKSEMTPRFHARDIAKLRAHYNNCLLVLSSATPSIESFYNANNGVYGLNRIQNRYGKAQLPTVAVADMNIEVEQGNVSGFSSLLLTLLEHNIESGRQSILLLNRRGHNTFVSCRKCKEVLSCPNCSISMTYHSANNRLVCHYCGYSVKYTNECPSCHAEGLRFSGFGTQRVETDLGELFPNAKILRLDADATMSKTSYEKKLSMFSKGEYNIMVGTQMVAKGLDFPNVTLVGVLSADQIMYSDDFRSFERAFSLLTQVVGRSGRGEHAGTAVIQSFTPENNIISLASRQDYDEFYDGEINLRRQMLYPPFADIAQIGFVGENDSKTFQAAMKFQENLCKTAKEEYCDIPLRILGATSASVKKISKKYRYKIILKFKNSRRFREMISNLLRSFGKEKEFSEIQTFIDINPVNIL